VIYRDSNFFIFDDETFDSSFEISKELFESRSDILDGLKRYPGTSFLLPTLKNLPQRSINVKSFYLLAKDAGCDATELVRIYTINNRELVSLDIAEELIRIYAELEARSIDNYLREDLGAYTKGDLDTGLLLRKQTFKGGLAISGENRTKYQNTEFDELFIELPVDSLITNIKEQIDAEDLPPIGMSSVCEPYPSSLYRCYGIDRVLEAPEKERARIIADILNHLARNGIKVGDISRQVSSFTPIPKEYVFGDNENNKLGIQENEKRFFSALVAFIKYHINLYNKSILTSASEEEVKAKNEDDFNSCNLPKRLEYFLLSWLTEISKWHYSHTGRYTLNVNLLSDDDDRDDEYDDDNNSFSAEFKLGKVGPLEMSDADKCLFGYIQFSGNNYGAGVWAEALIKLCRWGSRKPTELQVGKDNPNSMSLSTFEIQTVAVDLTKLEKVIGQDGRSLFAEGFFSIPRYIDGVREDVPSILIVSEKYKNPVSTDKEETVYSLIAFHDIVKMYVEKVYADDELISGLDFDGVAFTAVEDVDDVVEIDSIRSLNFQAHALKHVIKMCYDMQISRGTTLANALMNKENFKSYQGPPPAYNYIISEPVPTRMAALICAWIGAFDRIAQQIEYLSLSQYLNEYYMLIFDNFESFLGYSAMNLGDKKVNSISRLEQSEFFTGMTKYTENEIAERVEDEDMIVTYSGDISKLVFTKIIAEKTAPSLIGYYCFDKEAKLYIFASAKDSNIAVNQVAPPATYSSMSLLFLNASLYRTGLKNFVQVAAFVSESTVFDIYNAVSQHYREKSKK
jgi:hypothetical protein